MELRAQEFEGLKDPEVVLEKVAVPVGELGVAEVSVTKAVHCVAWFTATVDGLQLTLVLVLSRPDTPGTPDITTT